MRRRTLSCARLILSALWRRLSGVSWDLRPPTGECRLSGLHKDVWIRRDDVGVPHVFADNLTDLGFGAGVAMAQDRLWQMETLRRFAYGRLAEIAGDRPMGDAAPHMAAPSLLAVDRLYRSLRMQAVSREELSQCSSDGRDIVDGFARGVNAWVARCGPADLPPEFLLAGIEPEPWQPEDCLALGKLIGWLLSLAFLAKPILAALSADPVLARFVPPHLADGHCIAGGPLPGDAAQLDLLARHALGVLGPGTGSNNWVLGGERTASGKPLVCNDPHLAFGLPALWYPIALTTPQHRVIGATLPGVPGVLIGRNDHVAWGMTAVMADDGDFYRETLDEAGNHYRRDGEWRPIETVEELFRVRGRREVVRHTLRYVRHEGVLCPLLADRNGDTPTSFRWTGFEPWNGLDAILAMDRATSLKEFEAAARIFALPAQNVVAADMAGAIGYFCAGRFPRRSWEGAVPAILDGAEPARAWGGYLAWDEQPRVLNPGDSYIVTANNRVAEKLPGTLARGFWEPPYRATRVASLLAGLRAARVSDMATIQADVVSLQAAGIRASLIEPVQAQLADSRARHAAALLSSWDCRMTVDSPAAALFHLFYRELLERYIRPSLDERAPGLFKRFLSTLHMAASAADRAFLTADPKTFPGGTLRTVESCLAAAWDAAHAKLGPDPATWRWGAMHRLVLHHSLGRGNGLAVRALAWLFALNRGPFPRPGDGMTVNLAAFILSNPFGVAAGPSYRQCVDMGAPEDSRWVIAGGVSGDPRSRHYTDQLALWAADEGRPMHFLTKGEADDGVLRLVPADCVAMPRVL